MFRFDWAALTREEGDKLRQHLNERFVALEDRPAFMGPIEVVELEFGEQPPNLEMLDIRDADPEESEVALGDSFYGDDSDSLRLGASVSVAGEGSIYGDDDFDDTRSECSGFSPDMKKATSTMRLSRSPNEYMRPVMGSPNASSSPAFHCTTLSAVPDGNRKSHSPSGPVATATSTLPAS